MNERPAALELTATSVTDELDHVVCCDDNLALCGTDVTHARWALETEPTTCVVCADLELLPCEWCAA